MVYTVWISNARRDCQAPVGGFREVGVEFVELLACVDWNDLRVEGVELLDEGTGEAKLGVGASGADPLLLVELVDLLFCHSDDLLFGFGSKADRAGEENYFVSFHPCAYFTLFFAFEGVTCDSARTEIYR